VAIALHGQSHRTHPHLPAQGPRYRHQAVPRDAQGQSGDSFKTLPFVRDASAGPDNRVRQSLGLIDLSLTADILALTISAHQSVAAAPSSSTRLGGGTPELSAANSHGAVLSSLSWSSMGGGHISGHTRDFVLIYAQSHLCVRCDYFCFI
jgi:hypothetical protein